jgi:hypothetical protein
MVLFASDRSDTIRVARYSQKLDEYVVREINIDEDWSEHE